MNITIITGGNNYYILTLLDFIKSYLSQEFDPTKLIVYDLGLNKENRELVEELNQSKTNCFTIKTFYFSSYPEHVDLNKYYGLHCSYAFKPILVYNEAQLISGPILWMDSANRFNKTIIDKIENTILREGFYSPVSNKENTIESIELNHPQTSALLGLSEQECIYSLKSRSGNIVGFDYQNNIGKSIIDKWYECSLKKEIITPVGSSRNNHRQDQSVLSILIYLAEKESTVKFEESTFQISHWNKKDPPIAEEKFLRFALFTMPPNMKQIAIIYAETLIEAIQIYCDRKKMDFREFTKHFHVEQLN